MSAKRLRERDLTIFFCEWTTSFGQACRGIALPSNPAANLFNMFRSHFDNIVGVIEVGDGNPRDVGATPLLRYCYGNIIAYADLFDDISEILQLGKGFEVRSAIFKDVAKRNDTPGWALPEVAHRRRLPCRHAIDDWDDLRREILLFVYEMISNGSYQWLRRETREGFGIKVEERAVSTAGRFGALSLDWIAEDLTFEIVISINRDLSTAYKYVVLAHELAHTVLHLPLLFIGQLAEQMSWLHPSILDVVERRISTVFGDRSILEKDANRLASYMLVPPRIDPDALAQRTLEEGLPLESNEMLWRLFQHSFPEARIKEYSWRNLEELKKRARLEISKIEGLEDVAPESLYALMLEATLGRSSPDAQHWRQVVDEGIHKVFDMPNLDAVPVAKASVGAHVPIAVDGPSRERRIVGPLAGANPFAVRMPLVPASRGGKWISVINTAAPPRPLEEWCRDYPELAMVLYPDKSAPSFPVATFKERQ
ncbi:hypothetical protein AB0L25_10835 [Spirillospora sp. NPDC052242]